MRIQISLCRRKSGVINYEEWGKGKGFVTRQRWGLWALRPPLLLVSFVSIILLFDLTSPPLIHLEDSLNYISQLHGGVVKLN